METKFNFNTQVCTSIEQSEKLLELGLKKETADMWYPHFAQSVPIPLTEDDDVCNDDIPAWSLHRLIEMGFKSIALLEDADDEDEIFFIAKKNPFESMIEMFEGLIKEEYFNKEFLIDQDALEERCKGVLEYLDYIREEE